MLIVKISDALAAKLGAKNQEAAIERIESLIDFSQTATLTAEATEPVKVDINADLIRTELNAIIAKLDGFGATLNSIGERSKTTFDELEKRARIAGSQAASEALAAVGTQPVSAATPAATAANDQAAPARGDYKSQWERSETLQSEFRSAEVYAAYKRASECGQVRIFSKEPKS